MGRRVAVVVTAQTKAVTKRVDVSIPDMTYEVVAKALEDAELTIKDIDAVVFGMAPETFDGVNCPDKWCADAAGALNKPFMRINTGGATGLSTALAAVSHVSSGMFDVVLAVAEQRIKQTPDAQKVLNATYDPLYAQDIRVNIAISNAMELLVLMKKYGFTEYHNALIAVKNHNNALNNPYAHVQMKMTLEEALKSKVVSWPLKLADLCPSSEAGCAVIFASEEKARKICRRPAWVKGFADTTGTPHIGGMEGEDHTQHWDKAAWKAYKMAGISNPRKEIQVAETYHPLGPFEIPEYAAFGFCEPHEVVKLVESGCLSFFQ